MTKFSPGACLQISYAVSIPDLSSHARLAVDAVTETTRKDAGTLLSARSGAELLKNRLTGAEAGLWQPSNPAVRRVYVPLFPVDVPEIVSILTVSSESLLGMLISVPFLNQR